MTEEAELAKKILLYRKEMVELPEDPSGIRILLPDVDRHYYINLRTKLDFGLPEGVRRDVWMYFPNSHLSDSPPWPDNKKLAIEYESQCLEEFNQKNEADQKYGFPFSATGIVFKAISDHNEYFFNSDRFIDFCQRGVKESLDSLFGNGPDHPPRGYNEFSWKLEKSLIYDELPEEKIWVFYPLSFRGMCFSLLLARIPSSELEKVVDTLPLISGFVSEKLLSRYTDLNKNSPLLGINNNMAALTLISMLAAQCQLNDVVCEGRTIRFFSNTNDGRAIDKKSHNVRIGSVLNCAEFDFPSQTDNGEWRRRADYFDTLWKSAFPMLRRFFELSSKRSSYAKAAIMSRNFSHNVGSHSLANPYLHQSIGIENLADPVRIDIKHRLEKFHSYAQGRLDFLARAISESEERPEPLFFLNDVLERGFFSQGVLLDTFIEDIGFPASKIEFHVIIRKSNESDPLYAVYNWNKDRHWFIRDEDSDIEDLVVGIPGGMTSTHALYAFLENIMRNAVKYGNELQQKGGFTDNLKIYGISSCGRDISP